jgi:putative transposase
MHPPNLERLAQDVGVEASRRVESEWLDDQDFASPAAAHAAVADYIDGFYNPTRRHSHLDYVSPIEFELKSQRAAIAA